MSRTWDFETLIAFLEGDREIVERLRKAGLLAEAPAWGYSAEEVEIARIARTLVRELEVNWEGVEVILHMRTELIATRRQLAELIELVRTRRPR